MNENIIKALNSVIASGVEDGGYYDAFCDELVILNVNEDEHDFAELFEKALMLKGLV